MIVLWGATWAFIQNNLTWLLAVLAVLVWILAEFLLQRTRAVPVIGQPIVPNESPAIEPEKRKRVITTSFTREEMLEREEYRSYITQQLGVGKDIQHQEARELRSGYFPNRARSEKWAAETYFGLKDRNLSDAEYFSHPNWGGDLDDRIQRLINILDWM